MTEKRDYFLEIREHIRDNPGTTDQEIRDLFGSKFEVGDAVLSLLSGNWIDPDGSGGYIFRELPSAEDLLTEEDRDDPGVDYPWETEGTNFFK